MKRKAILIAGGATQHLPVEGARVIAEGKNPATRSAVLTTLGTEAVVLQSDAGSTPTSPTTSSAGTSASMALCA